MPDMGRPYKSRHHGVSRKTIAMRKARDEDARRLAERDAESGAGGDDSRGLAARGALRESRDLRSGRRDADSGVRSVVVRREGEVSARLSTTRLVGEKAASVRTTGGDTIVRYTSGDMVIRRGARRAQYRRQAIWVYAAGYLLLFGAYAYFLLTGTTTVTPDGFVEKAFSRRASDDIIALERAAMDVMRGNRTPAEIRMAEAITFFDENRDQVRVAAGDRLTLLTAAKLGRAIIEDEKRPQNLRVFAKPFRIYRETYLSGLSWPWLLTAYNAVGFFLLAGLFLWRPITHYLGTQGKKTAVAIRNARGSRETEAEYRHKFRTLAADIERSGDEQRAAVLRRAEKERKEALEHARLQTREISGGVENALDDASAQLSCRMASDTAKAACDRAREILGEKLGQKEHDLAIEELIADIANAKFA